MPYDNSYKNWFDNRAVGQMPYRGYTSHGRHGIEQIQNNYFQNRAVGQSPESLAGRTSSYTIQPLPAYTVGFKRDKWYPPPITPTTVYSGDVNDETELDEKLNEPPAGIRMQHVAIALAAAVVLIVLIVK